AAAPPAPPAAAPVPTAAAPAPVFTAAASVPVPAAAAPVPVPTAAAPAPAPVPPAAIPAPAATPEPAPPPASSEEPAVLPLVAPTTSATIEDSERATEPDQQEVEIATISVVEPASGTAGATESDSESPPSAAAESSEAKADANFGERLELEELWSTMLEELQKRHAPAFSLVSMYGFPLSFEKDDLVVGLTAENLQKTLENKTEQIKAACTAVLGREISVRVKLVGNANSQQSGARSPARQKDKKSSPAEQSADEPERAPQRSSAAIAVMDPRVPAPAKPAPDAANPPEADQGASEKTVPAAKPEPKSDEAHALLNEARKLFDGPGSRFIS
ncbi:MAG: hypothetical protein ACRD3W_09750, partial [Terriglobales bacterium]